MSGWLFTTFCSAEDPQSITFNWMDEVRGSDIEEQFERIQEIGFGGDLRDIGSILCLESCLWLPFPECWREEKWFFFIKSLMSLVYIKSSGYIYLIHHPWEYTWITECIRKKSVHGGRTLSQSYWRIFINYLWPKTERFQLEVSTHCRNKCLRGWDQLSETVLALHNG